MKKRLVLVIGLLAMPFVFVGLTYAATLKWDRNTEPDMKEYNIYGCDTGITCVIGPVKIGTVPQSAVGIVPSFPIPTGKDGRRAVTSVDTSGNESAMSVPLVPFDGTAPGVPTNPRAEQ